MLDALRSEAAERQRVRRSAHRNDTQADRFEERVERRLESAGEASIGDEQLRLLFASCHPSLAMEARLGLTLRFVGGLTVTEISRLLLAPEPTIAARLTRAKRKIAEAGIPLRVPPVELLAERVDGVLTVVYLLFTEGYSATTGPTVLRAPLAEEAIRIARLLVELMADEPRAQYLLALMILQHSRRDARFAADGSVVAMTEQDRERWHHDEIVEGLAILHRVLPAESDPYWLQAMIAAEHALDSGDAKWVEIARWYARLEEVTGSPVVRMNRAVAVAEADGPAAGLALLSGLDDVLPRSHQLPIVRAELLVRLGDLDEARRQFERAVTLAGTEPERQHLIGRLDAVASMIRPDH